MPKTIEAKTLRGHRLAALAAGGVSLALVFLPGAAFAADTQLVWEGFATVTASTPQCSGNAVSPGDTHVSIFRPKIFSTDTPTLLSIVFLRALVDMENTSESTVHQMNGSGNYVAASVSIRAFFQTFMGTYSLTVTPAAIIASTPSVTITGTINNFFNVAGCSVTFTGVYVQALD